VILDVVVGPDGSVALLSQMSPQRHVVKVRQLKSIWKEKSF
jgi:hypothetical protein